MPRLGQAHRALPPLRRKDRAVSEVMGSVLLVGLTVAIAAGFFLFVLAAKPGPINTLHAKLDIGIESDSPDCAPGESLVRVQHLGGEELKFGVTTIVIDIGDGPDAYSVDSTNGIDSDIAADATPFADDLLAGESWGRCYALADDADVSVTVIHAGKDAQVVAATKLAGSGGPCLPDTEPPSVLVWEQGPLDVTGVTVGPVTVTVTLADACGNLPGEADPHLHWRINDGSPPDFVDDGPMTETGPDTWSGDIPAQPFDTLVGDVLEYKVGPLEDGDGNSGESEVVTDLIQCSDVADPTVTGWTQLPADLKTTHVGPVTVTLALDDDCSGINVDPAQAPHLWYRLDPQTTTFTDAGAMVPVGAASFEGSVPDLTWGLQGGQTLEYYVAGVKDNAVPPHVIDTGLRGDLVETITVYTYLTCPPLAMTKGSVISCGNARNANDGGLEATVLEGPTTSSTTTSDLFATALVTASTASNPNEATGPPDGSDAVLRSSDEFVRVGGYASVTGTITDVRVCYVLEALGSLQNDQVRVSYFLGGIAGATKQSFQPSTVGSADCFTVYGDRIWTVSDVMNTEVEARFIVKGAGEDPGLDIAVDALYLRVTTGIATYDLDMVFAFTAVPIGVTEVLEIGYRTVGDMFDVQVWDGTDYVMRLDDLSSATQTTATYTLTATEYNVGLPRIRLVDFDPTGTTQGQFIVDYIRVKTN